MSVSTKTERWSCDICYQASSGGGMGNIATPYVQWKYMRDERGLYAVQHIENLDRGVIWHQRYQDFACQSTFYSGPSTDTAQANAIDLGFVLVFQVGARAWTEISSVQRGSQQSSDISVGGGTPVSVRGGTQFSQSETQGENITHAYSDSHIIKRLFRVDHTGCHECFRGQWQTDFPTRAIQGYSLDKLNERRVIVAETGAAQALTEERGRQVAIAAANQQFLVQELESRLRRMRPRGAPASVHWMNHR
ncbi:MAG TPA: hypothetical protein VGK29_20125 [Paludibaculum sp.]|jgi:hypothetical protein